MSQYQVVNVKAGRSVLLPTGGNYCEKDIVVNAEKGGIDLPELSNPARAEQIVSGYEAIDEEGAVIVGINPYEMAETDETVAEQSDLIEQIAAVLRSKSAGDASVEDGIITRTLTEYRNDRITSVGKYAFNENSTIKSISLPNVTTIGTYAFCNCTALETIAIPNLTTCSERSFQGDTNLKSIDFPLLENVGRNLCYGCTKLENVNLPAATKLGYYCFTNCKALKRLDFPVLTYIENNNFQGCTALETLILRADTICKLNGTAALSSTPIASGTGYVYVRASLAEEYRNSTNWSNYSEQIRAIEDYPEICGG